VSAGFSVLSGEKWARLLSHNWNSHNRNILSKDFFVKYFVEDMILSLQVVIYLIQILSNRHNNAKSHIQSLTEFCGKNFPFTSRNFSILSFKSYDYLYIRPQLSQVNKYAKFNPHSQVLYHSKLL